MPSFRVSSEYLQFRDASNDTDKITITTVENPLAPGPEILVINTGDFTGSNFAENNVMMSFNPTGRETKV